MGFKSCHITPLIINRLGGKDTHTHTHTRTHAHTHIYIHTYTYTHTYIHTHTLPHIHTHTHTHAHMCKCFFPKQMPIHITNTQTDMSLHTYIHCMVTCL